MMKKVTLVLLSMMMFVGLATAQNVNVSGTVVSAEDGESVIGASVLVKGKTIGTVTDFDGNFTLSVPSGSKTLVVSYIGMKTQEVAVKSNVKVVLESDSELLDEVVVTAMGISREKKALGYAVQDVGGEELTKAANTSLASAMQGKVSGVEITPSSGMPGASAKITIRGARSFSGDNSPLYVVDGMPIASTSDMSTGSSTSGTDYANRALDIDPNDIESVNILKGQAASALYGMRASNGVIVITTKSGKGATKGRPEVTINTNLSFDKVSTLFDYQTEFAQGMGGKFNPMASTSWGPKISELANDPVYGGNTDNKYTQAGGKKQGMYYVPQRELAGLDPWATPQAYNNPKDYFQTGHTWSNSVNVAQAFDKGNYSFSLGNTTQEGIVPNTGLDRYNVKMNATAKLHSNWDTGFSGNFVTSKLTKQTGANDGIVATIFGAPASYDLVGIPYHVKDDPYKQTLYRAGFDNPFWAAENNEFTERTQRFFGNTFLQYTTKFNTDNHQLNVKYQLGIDAYSTDYTDSWGYGSTKRAQGAGEIEHYGYTSKEFNSLATAVYKWDINEDLTFDALAGSEFIHSDRKYYYTYGTSYNLPGWNHIDNAKTKDSSESYSQSRTVGFFANAALAYKNMLYLNATVRNDIVSTMPRNNRSFTYPSISLGWIFTELEPLKNDILTHGKLRASYAEVGMAGSYYDSYYITPGYGGGFYSGTPMLYPMGGVTSFTPSSAIYDPNLKPQNTKSYEVGLDLSFLNDRISVNYTYSRQNVKDQIFSVPLAGSTGSSSLITNGGSIHTNVHEVNLNVVALEMKNFRWSVGANFSKIDNYVDELAEGVDNIFLGGFVDPQVRANIGDKFPVLYGVTYMRNDNGDILVDEKGMPMAGGEDVIGNVAPDFMLGFNTAFDIYKLRIAATFDWKSGGQMYLGTKNVANFYGTTQESADYRKMEEAGFLFTENAVKEDGTPNDIKIHDAFAYFDVMSTISEAGIYDAGFLKLRELSASYPVYETKGLAVNLSAFARNIILWNQADGFDPEASQGNNNMGGGFERFSLPGASSYGFGLNVKF